MEEKFPTLTDASKYLRDTMQGAMTEYQLTLERMVRSGEIKMPITSEWLEKDFVTFLQGYVETDEEDGLANSANA